jgi:transcriptional regulator with XRE-family HTH domain
MAQTGFGERFKARYSAGRIALASNVRRFRKERELSQEQLAARIDVEQTTISLIENKRANPTLAVLEKLARALDVGLPDLFEPPPRIRRSKA